MSIMWLIFQRRCYSYYFSLPFTSQILLLFSPCTLHSHSSCVGQGLQGNNRTVFLTIIAFLFIEMRLRVLTWYFPRLLRPTCFRATYSLVTFSQTVNCHVTWRHNRKMSVRSVRNKQRKHATWFWNLYSITLHLLFAIQIAVNSLHLHTLQ